MFNFNVYDIYKILNFIYSQFLNKYYNEINNKIVFYKYIQETKQEKQISGNFHVEFFIIVFLANLNKIFFGELALKFP